MPLPRFFVPRAASEPMPPGRAALLTQLRDTFRLGAGGPQAVVGVDMKGRLQLVTADVPASLTTAVRGQLVHHEATGRSAREVDAVELWLFDPQLVEQAVDTPGVNDPVQLHGVLYGPFDGISPATATRGTLTVTRADVLAAVLDELEEALRVTGPGGLGERCLHLCLPGGLEQELAEGRGIVLAWPSLPAELDASDVANEPVCKGLLFDLLAAMQVDLRAVDPKAAFAGRTIPIPSRPDLERELQAEGWEVKGDTATRLDASLKRGLGSLLTSVLGVPDAMTRRLPPEGTFDEFLALAREALSGLPGWPDARYRSLRSRIRPAGRPLVGTLPTSSPVVPPRPASPSPPPGPRPIPNAPRPPPDWSEDFGPRAASPPGRRPTRVTTFQGRDVLQAVPDWMKDFE